MFRHLVSPRKSMIQRMPIHPLERAPAELKPITYCSSLFVAGVVSPTAVAHPTAVTSFCVRARQKPSLCARKDLLCLGNSFVPSVIA